MHNYSHFTESETKVLKRAERILAKHFVREDAVCSADDSKQFLRMKLAGEESEVFGLLLLDNQHRVICYEELFRGTVNASAVYPREVVKVALANNAAAVIFAHNHPSGVTTPSESDKSLTNRLKESLSLIDIRVLDHIIVGKDTTSFAELGLL